MADAQTLIANDAVGPTKASESQFASVAASAGIPAEPVPVEGRLGAPRINARVTGEPVLGQPQFFPANPMMVEKLAADNKDVKQISTGDRTSSGGILRTISDVITELRSKRQNNKRAREQKASTGSPTKAKFLKEAEKSTTSTSKAKALTADASVGSLKTAGSGNKVPRMTCFGTSDGPLPEKKPSLAQRYSAWKGKQAERRAASALPTAAPGAKGPEVVVVSEKATAAEAEKVATTQGA
ncbi:hypothetical protein ABBQ38_004402 [Trebouxia sp. C0009 RCD-2024]